METPKEPRRTRKKNGKDRDQEENSGKSRRYPKGKEKNGRADEPLLKEQGGSQSRSRIIQEQEDEEEDTNKNPDQQEREEDSKPEEEEQTLESLMKKGWGTLKEMTKRKGAKAVGKKAESAPAILDGSRVDKKKIKKAMETLTKSAHREHPPHHSYYKDQFNPIDVQVGRFCKGC